MQAKPTSVAIKGIVIDQILGFRYGQQIQEQRFFELRFRQSLFGGPFSFGSDDAEKYNNQPVTLYFEGGMGKLEAVSGTIVKLEFVNNTGQQAEVIVSGTMYHPSNYFSKFALFLTALLLVPLLFIGSLFLSVSHLGSKLVEAEGAIKFYQDRSSKGFHRYTFKIAPYDATFYRQYHRPMFNTPIDQIDELFKADGAYNEDSIGQRVNFYVSENDKEKLQHPAERVNFFYFKSVSRPFIKSDYNFDILAYITNKPWFFLVWIFYMLVEVFCFVCAYFCYKMYALQQQGKNKVIWITCLTLAIILNIIALSLVI